MIMSSNSRSHQFDVVVVGGGIIGLGIASALARRRKKVLLVERGTCHNATSANSHRIIHGGMRYIQNFDLKRLKRSIQALDICLHRYPDAISPLRCYLPLPNRGLKRPSIMFFAGLIYSFLTKLWSKNPTRAGVVRGDEVAVLHPLFSRFQNGNTFSWFDGRLNSPEKLSALLGEEIIGGGGEVWERITVEEISRSDSGFLLSLRGEREEVGAKSVVLALGPWFGSLSKEFSLSPKSVKWVKAFNLVLSYNVCSEQAVGVTSDSGRVLFFSPRQNNQSAVGTWYAPLDWSVADFKKSEVTEEEIDAALLELNSALNNRAFGGEELSEETRITRDDIERIESGVLPMKALKDGEPVLYGSEEIFSDDGIFEVLSTKYTAFPTIGEDVAEQVERYLMGVTYL